ncbi:unnamed protein product [Orchesella dallaii]|uniref:Ionotropic glutamate receptor C-terminal domain-containing protein n=1 Tax=Orchesella dallaii TaxID=48710 RepID=A0ABP1PQ00_9HEXA
MQLIRNSQLKPDNTGVVQMQSLMFQLATKISEHFGQCEFLYTSVGKRHHSRNFSDILSTKIFHEETRFIKQMHEYASGVFIVSLEKAVYYNNSEVENRSSPPLSYKRFKDVHKNEGVCGLGLFSFSLFNSAVLKVLFDLLIPLYGPILRKDEDHFIFMTLNQYDATKLLLSEGFGNRIKYKIALTQSSNLSITALSTSLYENQGQPVVRPLFTMTQNDQVSEMSSDVPYLFPDAMRNFYGKIFRMSIPKVAFRFEMVWDSTQKQYVSKRGYYKWWLDEVMIKFNFTCFYFESSFGGGTGKLLSNGSWRGAVADILDGSADWAFVVGHIYSRHQYLEWSGPLSYEWMVFLNHKPKTFLSPKAIFWPFTPFMWMLFLLTIFVVPLVLKLIDRAINNQWSYGKLLEYIFATVVEQDHGGPCVIPVNSIRILGAFWLLFAMIVTVVYRGKLTALLAFPVKSLVPTIFEELASSPFRVGLNVVGKGGAAYSILSASQSPVYKTLFERMEIYPNADECLVKATQIDLSCIMWAGIADYISARNLSDRFGNHPLQPSSETTSFIADGLVWEKRAVFRKHLDKTIWSAIEMGLVPLWFQLDQRFIKRERWKRESEAKNGTVTSGVVHFKSKGPEALRITHLQGAFLILLIGIGLASEEESKFYNTIKSYKHNPLVETSALISSGVFSSKFKLSSNSSFDTTRVLKYQRLNDVHRLSILCGFALFSFNTLKTPSAYTFSKLFSTYTPRYNPILKKDEDIFVFLPKNQNQGKEILFSDNFAIKIKFKLIIVTNSSSVLGQTIDIYGNNGLPLLKTLFKVKSFSQIKENTTLADWFPDTTKNFQGKVFNMAIPKVAFRFEISSKNGNLHPRRGYYKWWLDEAIRKFNFSYNMFPSSFGGSTGKLLENGTWIGAVGDILYGKADWSFVVGHTYQRHPFIEWSGPLSYEWMVFLNHKPKTFYSPMAIFWPFTTSMWCMSFLAMILVVLAFKLITNLVKLGISYGQLLEYVFATILEQDQQIPCKKLPLNSIRLLVAFWLLSAIIIATAYRGKLVSLMAFPLETWVPVKFSELASSSFRVGLNVVGKGGAAYSILASSQSPIYKTLFERMEIYPDAQECLLKAIEMDLSCIMWGGVADHISARNLSDKSGNTPLQSSSDTTFFIADGLVWEKRAVFRKHLDKTIWAAFDMGLTIRWFQLDVQYLKNERLLDARKSLNATVTPIYSSNSYLESKGPEKLKLAQFKGVLYILFGGLLVSTMYFALEVSINFFILMKVVKDSM